jgi:hypothetical protein
MQQRANRTPVKIVKRRVKAAAKLARDSEPLFYREGIIWYLKASKVLYLQKCLNFGGCLGWQVDLAAAQYTESHIFACQFLYNYLLWAKYCTLAFMIMYLHLLEKRLWAVGTHS